MNNERLLNFIAKMYDYLQNNSYVCKVEIQ